MDNSTGMNGKSFVNCTSPMNSTTSIYIDNLSSNQFPNILENFPNLEILEYESSNISVINASLIPSNVKVKVLKCKSCKFKRVPDAINQFRLLEDFRFENNDINFIGYYNFNNLQNLWVIDLSGNPITYISRNAFMNLARLQYLNLRHTKLTAIPQAVMRFPYLRTLEMGFNINCTCVHPRWLKQWAIHMSQLANPEIYGGCHASQETLGHFVLHTLPNCL